MTQFSAFSCPANVSLLPGSKLRFVRRLDNGLGLYLEEEFLPVAARTPQTQSLDHNADSGSLPIDTTSQFRRA
jgi:hypothetical protein